jgi:hypothetical protein
MRAQYLAASGTLESLVSSRSRSSPDRRLYTLTFVLSLQQEVE